VAEGVIAEAIAGLVIVLGGLVVVENPARVLGPSRLMHETAEFVVLALPEPAHAAMPAMLAPELGIDAAVGAQRRHKFVAVPGRALREFLRAGEIEADAFEGMRQLGHGRSSP